MMKPFEGLLGNTCELRIINLFLPLEGVEFNTTELCEEVKVSRPTANIVLKKLVKWGFLKISVNHKKPNYYKINTESPFVKLFEDLNNLLTEQILGDEILYEIHDYFKAHSKTDK